MTNQTATILRRTAAGFALALAGAAALEGLGRAIGATGAAARELEPLPVLLLVIALCAWLLRTPGGLGAAAGAWLACLYRFYSADDVARLAGLAVALPAVAGAAGLLRRGVERDAAADAMRLSESRLDRAQATAGLGTWEVDWTTKAVTWSPEMYRLFGVSPDRFTPSVEAFFALVPPEEHAAIHGAVEEAVAGRAPYRVEHRIVRPADGETRYVSEHAEVERDAAGRPLRFAGTMLDVTDRRRAEESLRRAYASLEESEQRLRLGLDAGEVGTWDWDIAANRVTWSQRLYQFHGLAPGAFGGTVEAFAKLIHPDDAARAQEALRGALEERAEFRLEFRTIRPTGGAVRWLFTTGRVTFDDTTGRPVRMMGATIDVTDRRRVEDLLRESERSLRLVTDHLPALVSYVDRGVCYRFNNRTYQAWFGTPAGELCGRHMRDLLGDEVFRQRQPFVEAALRGEPQRFEGHTRRADGTICQTDIAYVPDRDDVNGTVRGFYVMAHDVSERRRVEQALRDNAAALQEQAEALRQQAVALRLSEERHERAAAAGKVGVWDLDLDGGELYLAPNLKAMLGYDPADPPHTLGEWRALIHPDDLGRAVNALGDHLDGRSPAYEAEVRRRHKRGHYLWCLVRGTALRDASGRPYRLTGSDTDITERKAVEEELRRAKAAADAAREEAERAMRDAEAARQAAESANAAKDHFLAVLSHELRTPLTPVLAAASELAGRADLPPGVAEDARMIRRNIELEARLIDDLLDLTRIARGKLTLNLEPTDAHALLREAAEICAADLAAKRLSLRLDLPAREAPLVADPARLQQVFWNLLKNAIKFTPEGGEILVATEGGGGGGGGNGSVGTGTLRVRVRDTGIGLLPGQVPRIFDAFEQADANIAKRFGGLGLGLAIARALVELHGGRLAADSDGAGRGSTFTVELPLKPTAPHAPAPPLAHDGSAANGKPPAGVSSRRLRILLIEDHDDTRRIMSRLLKSFNYDVESAGDVRSALDAAAARPAGGGFDLAISDLGLPDGTGYELMRELRTTYGLRGIALSGYGMDEDIRRSHEAGFVAHVTKPVNLQTLRSVIEQVSGRERGG